MVNKRSFILILLMVILYIVDIPTISLSIGHRLYTYLVKPLLWIGLLGITLSFPKIRTKGNHRIKSTITFLSINSGVGYIICLVIAGFISGFGRSPYKHDIIGIMSNILFVVPALITREHIRSYLINKTTKKELGKSFVLIALVMTILSIPFNRLLHIQDLTVLIKQLGQYILPLLCQNLLTGLIVLIGGPIPSITYLGIIESFNWLSPVLPNINWITKALIGILYPMFIFITIQNSYNKLLGYKPDKDQESPISWVITSLIAVLIVWFAVGVFPVYPSVIATGSMEPSINVGDIILLKRIEGNQVKLDDVIQFKRDNVLISHRVIEIKESDEEIAYKTKGDNNSTFDSELVNPNQVKGVVIYTIPKLGWPTLIMKSNKDIDLKEIVF